MDNRTIDVTSEGDDALALALRLIWDNAPGKKATHYKVVRLAERTSYFGSPVSSHSTKLEKDDTGTQTLILLWSQEKDAQPLPWPMDFDGSLAFVKGWLAHVEPEEEPDHDGHNGPGWRVFTEQWGHVAGHHYAIVGVQHAWAMYGK